MRNAWNVGDADPYQQEKPMRTQNTPELEPFKKDLTISVAMGANGREREYMEHYRAQGVKLKAKYTGGR